MNFRFISNLERYESYPESVLFIVEIFPNMLCRFGIQGNNKSALHNEIINHAYQIELQLRFPDYCLVAERRIDTE